MAYIGRDIEYGVLEKQTLTADSSTVAFDLTYSANANGLIVSVGGIVQEPNVAYTVLGSTLTFTAAPTTGDTVYVVYLGQEMTVSDVTPIDSMDYQVGTGDGSDTTPITTLNHSVSLAQDIMVTLNGIRQVPSTDYNVNGTTLTFTTAPADGVAILVYFLLLVRVEGTVVDNSVTDAKIVGMSGSKITTGTVPAGAASNASIIGMDAAKLTGSLPNSMGADLSLPYQRLATLGLHVQNVNNKVAFNLTNSFLDSFEDSTGVAPYNGVAEIPAVAGHLADHSTTGHTITKYGTVSTSTSIKKFGASSIYLGGGNYLTAPSSSDWVFSGDFTIETWINKTVNNGGDNAVMMTYGTDQDWGQNGWIFRLNGSDQISFQQNNGSGGAGFTLNASTALSIDTWHHVAIVKSGTSYKLYLNGTEDGATTGSNSIQDLGHRLTIGADYIDTASTRLKPSYMDDIRISNNARYTGNFSVPTATFTNDSNTLLLMNGNEIAAVPAVPNTGSVNALVSSDEYVTSASELDTATNIAPSSNDWDYTFHGTDFTVAGNSLGDHTVGGFIDSTTSGLDCPIYGLHTFDGEFVITFTLTAKAATCFGVFAIDEDDERKALTDRGAMESMTNSFYWHDDYGSSGTQALKGSSAEGSFTAPATGSVIVMRRIADGTITLEDDGAVLHTYSSTYSGTMRFCISGSGGSDIDLDNLFYEDTAKIQRDGFFNEGSGTSYAGGGDNSGMHMGTSFVATRTMSIESIKYSIDSVTTAYNAHFEVWSSDGTSPVSQIGGDSTSNSQDSTGARTLTFSSAPSVVKGTEYWVVLVDEDESSAGNVNCKFIDDASGIGGGNDKCGRHDTITSISDGTNSVQDVMALEIKGTVTGEPTPDHDTLLLVQSDTTNGSQTFVDSSQNARTITVTGDSQHSTAQSKFGASSLYFDGTGDYIHVPNSTDWEFQGDGSFTIDFWMKTTNGGRDYLVTKGASGAWSAIEIDLRMDGSGYIEAQISNNGGTGIQLNSTTVVSDGNWHHIALVRVETRFDIYVDGVSEDTETSSLTILNLNTTYAIGADSNGNNNFTGHLDEIRISNVARWDADFTPPTAAYGTSTNTTLSATGSLASTSSTADSAVSEVTGALLVKDSVGTNTIGTDLKAYFSSDNGSNWTEAASYDSSFTFDGTTKVIPLGETTLSNTGTAVKMKAEWANQVATVPASGTTKVISPVGDANFSSSQVKFGNSAIYFPTTSGLVNSANYIEIADDATWDYGTGDFTWEMWVNVPAIDRQKKLFGSQGWSNSGAYDWIFDINPNRTLRVQFYNGSAAPELNTTATIPVSTWTHVAATRSSGTMKIFIDGVESASATKAESLANNGTPYLGWKPANNQDGFVGYMDEVRLSNTARYTSAFTPSTTAFTSDANTQLLLHSDTTDDGSMLDSSSNGHTIINATESGSGEATHSTTQSKIGSTSINFPADGTNLEIGVSDDFNWVGDFTIEAWFWRDPSDSGNSRLFNSSTNPASGNQETISIDYDGTNIRLFVSTDGSSRDIFSQSIGGSLLTNSTWHHIAFVRSGNDYNLYQNGSSIWNGSSSSTIHPTNGMAIGGYYNTTSGSATWKGYIDEIRISKTARYTSAFTPSTTAYTSDANTLLLIHSDDDSTTFTDSSSNTHAITAVGDAKHRPPFKKFGTSSLYCDGVGDLISVGDSDDFAFSGDYTVEFWFYFVGAPGNAVHCWGQGGNAAGNYAFFCRSEGGGTFIFGTSNGSSQRLINPGIDLSDAWHHIAMVKSGTSQKLYIDGTHRGSELTHTDIVQNVSAPWEFGGNSSQSSYIEAYFDEIRFSDSARYTANFTPSTTAFTTDANTKLLIHGDSTNPLTQIGQGVGAIFGNMTAGNGANAKAFDGTTSASAPNTATTPSATVNAYIGKDWGTSYNNTCGTGDRRSIITVTTDLNIQSGVVTSLVDGAIGTSNGWYPVANQNAAGKYIRFQLSYAKVINDVTFRTAGADGGLGIWKFQGSNDATTWTDLSGDVTLGNAITESFSLNNTTAYTYYQAVGVSGTPIDNWIYEFEFGEATGITGKTISGVKIYGSSNEGYCGGAGVSTIKLMGSNTLPSSASNGTELGAFPDIPDSNSTNPQQKMSGFTTTTAYRYHWLWNAYTNNDQAFFAEVEFYEGETLTDSSYAPEVIGKVAQLHGWAVNY